MPQACTRTPKPSHAIGYTNEFSETDKEKILGGTLRTWLRWPKAERASYLKEYRQLSLVSPS